jgi:hypothetical protein
MDRDGVGRAIAEVNAGMVPEDYPIPHFYIQPRDDKREEDYVRSVNLFVFVVAELHAIDPEFLLTEFTVSIFVAHVLDSPH